MDTWEYTQNQIDLGLRTIEKGNKIIQEAIEVYREQKHGEEEKEDSRTDGEKALEDNVRAG